MGLSDIIRAIQEYPAVRAELETAQFELRMSQKQKSMGGNAT